MELSWLSECAVVGMGYEDGDCVVMLEAGVDVEPLAEVIAYSEGVDVEPSRLPVR